MDALSDIPPIYFELRAGVGAPSHVELAQPLNISPTGGLVRMETKQEREPSKEPQDAPELPPTEPQPEPVQDPPAEPNPAPYVVRGTNAKDL